MDYPVTLERDDEGGVVARFPDFPDVQAAGEYEADALVRAGDVLMATLTERVRGRRAIPPPSVRPGLARVLVPILVEAKLHVYEAMRAGGIGRADLARRLRWHRPQVDRLLNLRHASRLDQIEAAMTLLGKRFTIAVQDIEATHGRHRRVTGRAAERRES